VVASLFAQWAVVHDSLAAVGPDRNSQAAAIQRHVWGRVSSRIVSQQAAGAHRISSLVGMRLVGVWCRRMLGAARRSGRPGGSLVFGWADRCAGSVRRAEACCSRGVLSLCEEGAGLATSFAQPGGVSFMLPFLHQTNTYLLRLGVHRQPVRVKAFVVCHGGGEGMKMRRVGGQGKG
jgi:hypothetical protein